MTFSIEFLKKFACAQKVGFPRSGHILCCAFEDIFFAVEMSGVYHWLVVESLERHG